jgi:hypothetical protein
MSKVEGVFFRAAAFGLIVAGILLRAGSVPPVRVDELVFGIGLCVLSMTTMQKTGQGN